MKTGIRHYENASCRVSYPMSLPANLRGRVREISHVDVPENLRKQGMATNLVANICDEADAHRMVLILTVDPFGDGEKMSKEDLQFWYERKFGFQKIQEKPLMMARMVFATPKPFLPTQFAFAMDTRNQK